MVYFLFTFQMVAEWWKWNLCLCRSCSMLSSNTSALPPQWRGGDTSQASVSFKSKNQSHRITQLDHMTDTQSGQLTQASGQRVYVSNFSLPSLSLSLSLSLSPSLYYLTRYVESCPLQGPEVHYKTSVGFYPRMVFLAVSAGTDTTLWSLPGDRRDLFASPPSKLGTRPEFYVERGGGGREWGTSSRRLGNGSWITGLPVVV